MESKKRYSIIIEFLDLGPGGGKRRRLVNLEHADDCQVCDLGVGILKIKMEDQVHCYPLTAIAHYTIREEAYEDGHND